MKETKELGLSRRDFLKGAAATGALAAGAVGLAGCTKDTGGVERWDYEADVVVCGYGGAGASTAVTAHDAGAKVIILEKLANGGGNTAVSGGGFLCPTNAEDAFTYISALYDYSLSDYDEDIVRVFANESVNNLEWFQSLDESVECAIYGHAGYSSLPGAESQDKWRVNSADRSPAQALFGVFTHAVEEQRGIQVLYNTPAKELIINNSGEVIGVIAEQGGQEVTIKAKRGVALTTGGYEFSEEMLKNYVKGSPIYGLGSPGNTGDGIRMAQKVGAKLWHMNGVSCPVGIKVPDYDVAFFVGFAAPGCIWVDKNAKRFVDEVSVEAHAGLLAVDHFSAKEHMYPRIPLYAIFDETTRLAGPFSSIPMGAAGAQYSWSKDNSAEIDKGWITKASSLSELASKVNLDAATLEATVGKWNEDVKNNEDTLFGRPITSDPSKAYLDQTNTIKSAPIEQSPFYAAELYPTLLNTQGGPKRNSKAQILDAFGEPIPRLYSSGELGCMWGIIYQGAGNNGESMAFGRIAGANLAAETPWDE